MTNATSEPMDRRPTSPNEIGFVIGLVLQLFEVLQQPQDNPQRPLVLAVATSTMHGAGGGSGCTGEEGWRRDDAQAAATVVAGGEEVREEDRDQSRGLGELPEVGGAWGARNSFPKLKEKLPEQDEPADNLRDPIPEQGSGRAKAGQ